MNNKITLEDLGYNNTLEDYRIEQKLENFVIGRVIAEHKERYIVKTLNGEFEAEITGNLRFTAKNREDFPAVGDWVAMSTYDAEMGIIYKIFQRFSIIKRQAVGQTSDVQIIATNIDYAFLVQAADRDFNINRIERYLTICYSAKVIPIIVLSKTDLIDKSQRNLILDSLKTRIKNVKIITISNETHEGLAELRNTIQKAKTYCLLGSSGVGKSTLLNNLSGGNIMKTAEISTSNNKGKHVTSHRELIVLDSGGILIDNPGMREVGIADTNIGLETTFDKIISLAQNCRFKNCTHTNELGCSVLEALEKGKIDRNIYKNYIKLEREKAYYESSLVEKKQKDKSFGKMLKNYKKESKN